MNKRNLKAMIPATSTDGARPSLQKVKFSRNGDKVTMVSTDGYILVRQRFTDAPPEDMPKVEGYTPANEALIPAEVAENAVKSCGKSWIPTRDIDFYSGDGHSIVRVQINNSTQFNVEPDEKYPAYERVVPRDNKFAFALDYYRLRDLLDSLKPLVGKEGCGYNGIEFFPSAHDKGIGFSFKGDNGELVDGVIMPVRSDKSTDETFGTVWGGEENK